MQLQNKGAQLFIPDGVAADVAVARTTHMAVGAHPDDIPIMAHHGILECFDATDRWFFGVTVTDGAGSPRSDRYAHFTDDEMREVRIHEEQRAAFTGAYGGVALLDYSSAAAKDATQHHVVAELTEVIAAASPRVLYTHNLADKHDTHVAVALRTIDALRELPQPLRPAEFYGCEVWRDLDWLTDADKVAFDVSARPNLADALIGVYDSQISGGKRYDLATAGRRIAHATFSESHAVDDARALIFAMDLMPLLDDASLDPADHVAAHVERTRREVVDRIVRLAEH